MSQDDRIESIEKRLLNLEKLVRHLAAAGGVAATAGSAGAAAPLPKAAHHGDAEAGASAALPAPQGASAAAAISRPAPTAAAPANEGVAAPESGTARVLGVGGVVALLLAASYLVRLALDSGWLTPVRQTGMASILGFAMIGTGLALLRRERQYASLLPAGGLAVLYLTILGAHQLYGLVDVGAAAVLIVVLSVFALALGHVLRTDVYALLAAATSYSVPLLLPVLRDDVFGLALYFCAWSVVYTVYAVWLRNRAVYLIALYLGLALFAHLPSVSPQWNQALIFQTLQLAIFGWGAVQFSIRTGRAMTPQEALAHAPALLFFYAVQYGTLSQHVPDLAPWIAISSALLLVGLYLIGRSNLGEATDPSAQLVYGYLALVVLHAFFIELLRSGTRPVVTLCAAPVAAYFLVTSPKLTRTVWPLYAAAAAMCISTFGYFMGFFAGARTESAADTVLSLLFAVELYIAYRFARGGARPELRNGILYGAHVMAVNALMLVLDNRLSISIGWAALAFVTMTVGIRSQDRDLGRSALLILGFLTAKAMLLDLSDAAPVVRILSLVVLGITLYGAGWIYQRRLSSAA